MSVILFEHDTNWKALWHVGTGSLPEITRLEAVLYPQRKAAVLKMLEDALDVPLDEDVEQ